jgi:hypothetical protein
LLSDIRVNADRANGLAGLVPFNDAPPIEHPSPRTILFTQAVLALINRRFPPKMPLKRRIGL